MDLNTKYGKVRIDKKGYYRIITSKEGNGGKRLHRLIFEDFYGYIKEKLLDWFLQEYPLEIIKMEA